MALTSFETINRKPIPFYGLKIHKPTLQTIEEIGEEQFFLRNNLLTISADDLKDFFEEVYKEDQEKLNHILEEDISPYSYHLIQCSNGTEGNIYFLELKAGLFTYLQRDILLSQQGIEVRTDGKENFVFTEETFNEFQQIVRTLSGSFSEEKEPEIITDNLEMKAKFEKKRKLLRETKRKERKAERTANPEDAIELGEIVSCLCAYGTGYNLLNVWDLTYSQALDQFRRNQMRDDYKDKISLISGGRANSQLKLTNWIKKITNN